MYVAGTIVELGLYWSRLEIGWQLFRVYVFRWRGSI